jgi:hypothetical protein
MQFNSARWLLAVVGWLLVAAVARAEFPQMAAAVPADANVMMLVDFDRIAKSDLAAKSNFKEKYEQMYASGIMTMPPDTALGLVAAQVDFEFVRPIWEMGVLELNREPSLAHIAEMTKGSLDSIGGVEAVSLPNDAYVVQMAARRLATMSPANRQTTGRWLTEIRERKAVGLSNYLKAALEAAADGEAEIVQAIDFEYAVKADKVRASLETAATLKNRAIDKDKLAQLIAGLRGLVLKINVSDKIRGSLVIDFSDDTSILTGIGKGLLIETLESRGAAIEDLAFWEVKPQGTQLLLQGELSPLGLRKVFSLIEMPNPAVQVNSSTAPAASKEEQTIAATKKYFAGVKTILTDGRSQWKDSKSTGQNAMWLEKWARKVDNLPLLNVDEDMVKYGQVTSDKLRDMALAIRGGDIRSAARKSQVYKQYQGEVNTGVGYGGPYGGYRYGWGSGYFETNDVGSERRAIGAQESAKANSAVVQRASEINEATGEIRKIMVDRYKVEF